MGPCLAVLPRLARLAPRRRSRLPRRGPHRAGDRDRGARRGRRARRRRPRGLPRRRARAGDGDTGGVFDADDLRSARELLEAAQAAVRRADWSAAVLDGFRAIARGLGERDLVPDVPGATARTIAARGAVPFPASAGALDAAATSFDAVRYLGAEADQDTALRVLDTEQAVRQARPARVEAPVVPA
ncbi:DUF4129 domain-containing protein [Curtobacterium poinsettiae]|uniref:DUF4129 domain-containing protein n=1 Tax=Curtobacterium poinsettiae TaxID=159612 RepID=UPI0021C8B27D|nr:DUF4129 domain-containing protein [Curtobacterium flaccumfaciens]UXN17868.1 DUF4129 domain-containing protein [Curtobacterium flaccumfaciens pv. poinsettiae]